MYSSDRSSLVYRITVLYRMFLQYNDLLCQQTKGILVSQFMTRLMSDPGVGHFTVTKNVFG